MADLDSVFASLRRSEPYMDDAGFTMAVAAGLPRRNELPLWVKNLILLAATSLGSAVAVWQLPPVLQLASDTVSAASNYMVIGAVALGIYAISLGLIWAIQKEMV